MSNKKKAQLDQRLDDLIQQQLFGKFISNPTWRKYHFTMLTVMERRITVVFPSSTSPIGNDRSGSGSCDFKPIHQTFKDNILPDGTSFRYEWVGTNRRCFAWVLNGTMHIPNTNLKVVAGMDLDEMQCDESKWLCEHVHEIERVTVTYCFLSQSPGPLSRLFLPLLKFIDLLISPTLNSVWLDLELLAIHPNPPINNSSIKPVERFF